MQELKKILEDEVKKDEGKIGNAVAGIIEKYVKEETYAENIKELPKS